jgi:hypothetical protein
MLIACLLWSSSHELTRSVLLHLFDRHDIQLVKTQSLLVQDIVSSIPAMQQSKLLLGDLLVLGMIRIGMIQRSFESKSVVEHKHECLLVFQRHDPINASQDTQGSLQECLVVSDVICTAEDVHVAQGSQIVIVRDKVEMLRHDAEIEEMRIGIVEHGLVANARLVASLAEMTNVIVMRQDALHCEGNENSRES